jgi:hypothetical protein
VTSKAFNEAFRPDLSENEADGGPENEPIRYRIFIGVRRPGQAPAADEGAIDR